MDKKMEALMWELVYSYINNYPKEAVEVIVEFAKKNRGKNA